MEQFDEYTVKSPNNRIKISELATLLGLEDSELIAELKNKGLGDQIESIKFNNYLTGYRLKNTGPKSHRSYAGSVTSAMTTDDVRSIVSSMMDLTLNEKEKHISDLKEQILRLSNQNSSLNDQLDKIQQQILNNNNLHRQEILDLEKRYREELKLMRNDIDYYRQELDKRDKELAQKDLKIEQQRDQSRQNSPFDNYFLNPHLYFSEMLRRYPNITEIQNSFRIKQGKLTYNHVIENGEIRDYRGIKTYHR